MTLFGGLGRYYNVRNVAFSDCQPYCALIMYGFLHIRPLVRPSALWPPYSFGVTTSRFHSCQCRHRQASNYGETPPKRDTVETASSQCGVHWDISKGEPSISRPSHFSDPSHLPNPIRRRYPATDRKSVLNRDYPRNKSVHENMEATL
jgi:hypothetical protein